ncbi:MAG: cation-efflux pump [Candidatus Thermoplasmatota archaeon]|nr:cation-efflux pump [Candidatus Thermoplasmatota archaeon]
MKLVPEYGDPQQPSVRAKYGYLEAAVSIVGNFLLAALKMAVGLLIGSVSIIADAVHTLSDVGTSIVVIVGMTAAKKEPDEEHPFGHGRYEYIATLLIAIVLFVVAVEIFLTSLDKFHNPTIPIFGEYTPIVYGVMVVGIISKELMARYAILLGKKINSKMLEADAWHHRADSITTIGVLAGLILIQLEFPLGYYQYADPALGIAISAYIGFEAIKLAKESADLLVGRKDEESAYDELANAAKRVEGVVDVHDLYVHDYGVRRIISLHVTVESIATTEISHRIATNVEEAVKKAYKGEAEAIVHVEPCGQSCTRDIERALVQVLKDTPEIVSYHTLRFSFDVDGGHITVHALVDKDMSVQRAHELVHLIDAKLKEHYPEYRLDVHVEPCDKACESCFDRDQCQRFSCGEECSLEN